MLIYLYLFSMIVGLVLLGASILLGGHDDADVDLDADADLDLDADLHAEVDLDLEGDLDADVGFDKDVEVGGHGDLSGILFTFLSLRFWTFFSAFFGLTGVTLAGLGLASSGLTLGLAIAMGFVTGFGAVTVIKKLSSETSGQAVTSDQYVGKTARVVVPFGNTGVGKVRVDIKGSQVDLLATGLDEVAYDGREEVLIVEMDGARARVARVGSANKG